MKTLHDVSWQYVAYISIIDEINHQLQNSDLV